MLRRRGQSGWQHILVSLAHLGDANNNAIVDIQDLTIVANNWQKPSATWSAGDLNLDGTTDIQEFTLVANNWQQTSTFSLSPPLLVSLSNTPIPEPAALPRRATLREADAMPARAVVREPATLPGRADLREPVRGL